MAGPRTDGNPSALYRPVGAPAASSIAVSGALWAENPVAYEPLKRGPLANPEAIHDIVATMQQVIQRGTGTLIRPILKDIAQPLAGKTGTTSNYFDAWFVGFSPDLTAGTYVGFDEPRTLGDGETGGHVAAGIFRDFIKEALKGAPAKDFPEPGKEPGPDKQTTPAEAAVADQETKPGEAAAEAPARKRAAPRPESDGTETAKLNRQQLDRDPARAVEEAAYGPRWRDRQRPRGPEPANAVQAEPAYAPPPRQPDYAAAGPGFPAPWGTAYAQPGGGAAYTGPAMPPPRRLCRVRATRWRRTRRRPRPGASGPVLFTAPAACTEGKSGIGGGGRAIWALPPVPILDMTQVSDSMPGGA